MADADSAAAAPEPAPAPAAEPASQQAAQTAATTTAGVPAGIDGHADSGAAAGSPDSSATSGGPEGEGGKFRAPLPDLTAPIATVIPPDTTGIPAIDTADPVGFANGMDQRPPSSLSLAATPLPSKQSSGHEVVNIPPMMHPLDEVLELPEPVQDLQLVTRDFAEGRGIFEAVHNKMLSKSLLSGSFQCTSSLGKSMRYDGTFLSDPHGENPMPCGQGVRTNPDGSTYSGQWKDGNYHGHGEWRNAATRESYRGDWKKGKKHGFGVQCFANGDVYEGDWADSKFQDRGKYVYANGDEFLGFFEKGVKVQGTFHYKDGRISTRRWQNGSLVSCQDFDPHRRSYQATITKAQVHDPIRGRVGASALGAIGASVVTPRGIRID
mmetsp:Transcript_53511/g.114419  ORF Transcript_53511/g.114419 Transcript_53511/m.114419 type:complete len:380 (+) Transcript_53511:80-1219(+)